MKKNDIDMTQGSILGHLLMFAVPLLLGNIFQQLYNTVDTWVVGNYVGKVAFSAVGTLSAPTNTVIGFFTGFSSGASVVISQYFGAGNKDKVHDSVHTYVTVTFILCLVTTALALLSVPLMLRILKSPWEVAQQQKIYLRIYFAGFSGLLIYNMGSAILRAVGNSVFPFILLLICTLSNIVLDLLFVLVFHMGTAGVAYATIIAQGVSAITVLIKLATIDSQVKFSFKDIGIDLSILGKIFRIGLPSAFQLSITAMSNMFVQSYVNFFGTDVMGGWTAYSKIDQLFFLPMQSIALSTTTFVGQNYGSKNIERARKGVRCSLYMSLVSTVCLVLPVAIFAPSIVKIFIDSSESEVIAYGTKFLRLNGFFFLASCFNQVYGGALRGFGKSEIAMGTMLFSYVLFRQICLFFVTRFIINTPEVICLSYPLGWILCSVLVVIFYRRLFTKNKLIIQ